LQKALAERNEQFDQLAKDKDTETTELEKYIKDRESELAISRKEFADKVAALEKTESESEATRIKLQGTIEEKDARLLEVQKELSGQIIEFKKADQAFRKERGEFEKTVKGQKDTSKKDKAKFDAQLAERNKAEAKLRKEKEALEKICRDRQEQIKNANKELSLGRRDMDQTEREFDRERDALYENIEEHKRLLVQADDDIEAERLTTESLQAAIEDSRYLVERLSIAAAFTLYYYDAASKEYTYSGRHIGETLGYDAQDIPEFGEDFTNLMHDDDFVRLGEYMESDERVNFEGEKEYEFRLRDADGQWRLMKCREVVVGRDDDGTVTELLGVLVDVTGRHEPESEPEKTADPASDNDQQLKHLLQIATEDIRTPLEDASRSCGDIDHAIARLSGKNPGADLGELNAVLDDMRLSVSRANLLVDGIAQLTQIEQEDVKIEQIDMNSLVASVISSNGFSLEDCGVDVVVGDMPSCNADRSRMELLFYHLIDNAVAYLDPAREAAVGVTGWEEDTEFVYCVEDNGVGITDADLEEAFAMFGRVHGSPGDGKGMGLAIVKRIVEAGGGRIGVESTPGQGSKFYVSIPKG